MRIPSAKKFTREAVAKHCPNIDLNLIWLNEDRFVYTDNSGQKPVLVNCQTGEKTEFKQSLPIPNKPNYTARISPDQKVKICTEDYNLFLEDLNTQNITQLTFDGRKDQAYAAIPCTCRVPLQIESGDLDVPMPGLFSPNGKTFLTHQLDERDVTIRSVSETKSGLSSGSDSDSKLVHNYFHPYAGDKTIPTQKLISVNLELGEIEVLNTDNLYIEFFTIFNLKNWICYSKDNSKIFYLRLVRGYKKISLREYDFKLKQEKVLLCEKTENYIEINSTFFWDSNVRILDDLGHFIWWSERDNYGHLYLYDLKTGRLKNQITFGSWVVLDVLHVDTKEQTIYFTGSGKEPGDVYYRYLYKINLDGSGLICLTPELGDHFIQASANFTYFIDSISDIRSEPVHKLRHKSGDLICTLETADLTYLTQLNWHKPENFKLKALDNKTDLYGEIFKPTDFDPTKKYPVIDHIYPGPQNIHVPKALCTNGNNVAYRWPGLWSMQALAELGFIVIAIDTPGSTQRSRDFREASYQKIQSIPLLEHKAALEKLAKKYKYIDLNRVGIVGHSAGGYVAARAILCYPDFYKVAVAGSGVHSLKNFMAYWSEKYQGLVNSGNPNYDNTDNVDLAENLVGKLLLIHGEKDDNVLVEHSLNLYQALVKAGKQDLVELLLLPCYHECDEVPEYLSKSWAFFEKWLSVGENNVEPVF